LFYISFYKIYFICFLKSVKNLGSINTSMRFKDIILREAPIPDDWDIAAFDSNKSFASRLRYAIARSKKIGTGSSRIAFEIEYKGRPTILKVAKNMKGMHQNEFEASMLNDYYYIGLGLNIPMIDYDESNKLPAWIHMEKADKMLPTQFKKYFSGLSPYDLEEVIRYGAGKKIISGDIFKEKRDRFDSLIENNDYISSLVDLIGNYDVGIGDLLRLTNWGVYKNHPVIIDIGGSSSIITKYYK